MGAVTISMFLYPPALSDWLKNVMLLSEPIRIEAYVTRASNADYWFRLLFFSFFFYWNSIKIAKKKERRLVHQSIINVKLEDGELTDNLYVKHDRSAKCFIFLFSNLTLYSGFVGLGKISGGASWPLPPFLISKRLSWKSVFQSVSQFFYR